MDNGKFILYPASRKILNQSVPVLVASPNHVVSMANIENGIVFSPYTASPINPGDWVYPLKPLMETWPSQFDSNQSSWFGGNHVLNYFADRYHINDGFPCAGNSNDLLILYGFMAEFYNNGTLEPIASAICTHNLVSPEPVDLPAFAVSSSYRQMGIGSLLFNYMVLLLAEYVDSVYLTCNTNDNPLQVSGGRTPIGFWENNLLEQFGKLPNYGTADSSVGNGIYFYANLRSLSQSISTLTEWRRWFNQVMYGYESYKKFHKNLNFYYDY